MHDLSVVVSIQPREAITNVMTRAMTMTIAMKGYSRVLLLLVVVLPSLAVGVADVDKNNKDAAMVRLLTASLSAPNADTASIISDAKALFGENSIDSTLLEEIIAKIVNTAPTCANATVAADDEHSSTVEEPKEQAHKGPDNNDDIPPYADRQAKRVASVRSDFDCMEREFDMNSPNFDPREAAKVLHKCRLLVVRNIWSAKLIADYKTKFSNYLSQLHEGKISNKGTTTLGEAGFWARRNSKRFDIILPKYLKNELIYANKKVKQIMGQPMALGDDFIINSIGAVIAESGAPRGNYHYDDAYLMGDGSFGDFSLAGTDLPPWAVTMFFPVSNVTLEQGPTEFCMGTNHFKGLEDGELPPIKDERLVGPETDFAKLHRFERKRKSCPDAFTRIPLLNAGDAIFFDYTITHRGGANTSPDLRAMQYIFYSRYWYRDSNFELESLPGREDDTMTENEIRTQTTRFAIIEGGDKGKCTEGPPCPERVPLESISDFMGPRIAKFQVTNVDLQGANLYGGKNGGKHLADVAVGETIELGLKVGSKLRLTRDKDSEEDDWIRVWRIQREQRPILLETQNLFKTIVTTEEQMEAVSEEVEEEL